MYKTIRKIHLWLSVPFGLIISLICITGLILLFQPHGEKSEFFFNVMRLHRWLFDTPAEKGAMTAGKMIIGVTTCGMLVVLITGIIMWCMKAKHNLASNLKIIFNKGFNTFCHTLHSAGGMYVVIFLLIMALTGLTWSFGWYRAGFNALFGIEKGSHIVYIIHSGAFGGPFTRTIWFIATLIGFTLPLTGYYLWIKRSCKK